MIVSYVAWSLWLSVKAYIYLDEVYVDVILWGALESLSSMGILGEQPEQPILTYKILPQCS